MIDTVNEKKRTERESNFVVKEILPVGSCREAKCMKNEDQEFYLYTWSDSQMKHFQVSVDT